MHIAVRSACVLPLVLAQISLPALAQSNSAPIVVPAQPLPPEKPPSEKQTPADKAAAKLPLPPDTLEPEPELPRPPVPPPAPEAESNYATPQDYPLSMQILQAHLSYSWAGFSPLVVTRGGIETPNLLEAVAESGRATALIRSGEGQVATGTALTISGIVVLFGTLLIGIPIIAANSNNSPYNNNSGADAALFIGTIVGAIMWGAGSGVQWSGYHQIVEGVNAYNADLLDGRLVPPAVTAVPPR